MRGQNEMAKRGGKTATRPKRVDRRVHRTRRMLQDALIAMMIEKGYESTTVQEIIDKADVGRATFYAHFADKRSLLTSRIEDLRAMLVERQRVLRGASSRGEAARQFTFSLPMLEHAREHLALYSAITGRESGTFVLGRIQQMLADLVLDDLIAMGLKRPSERRDLLAQHLSGAFMASLTWWLEHGAKLAPADVDAIYQRLAFTGVGGELA
jgi:AcrR family transcriptional regulator